MSEHTDQLAAIVTLVESVTDVGRVHDRPRLGDALTSWVVDIGGTPQVRAWEIGIQDGGIRVERLTGGGHHHYYRPWLVRGWLSIIEPEGADGDLDSADITHDQLFALDNYTKINDLAFLIATAINGNRKLDGSCLDLTTPAEMTEPKVLTIGGGPMCWSVDITFTAYTLTKI